MSVAYQIFSDWGLPLEEKLYATEALAIKAFETDPEIIASMEEENRTVQDFINLDWVVIVPREIVSE